jgi:N-acetylmuramoyl-L-alanine amidase
LVSYLGSGLVLDQPAVRLGDECFVSVKQVSRFGWQAKVLKDAALLSTSEAQATVFLREVDGRSCFPLRAAAQLLGGLTYWRDEGRCLGVFARIEWIGAAEGRLSAKTSLPVKPDVFTLDGPDRIVMDLPATLYSSAAPPVTKGLDQGVRVGLLDDDGIRIVCDLDAAPALDPTSVVKGRQYELSWSKAGFKPHRQPGLWALLADQPDYREGPVMLGAPVVSAVSDDTYTVTFAADRLIKGKTTIRRSAEVLEVEIPNAISLEDAKFESEDGFLRSLTSSGKTVGALASVVLRFGLTGGVGVKIAPAAAQLAITLHHPKSASGKLSEKIIVVDPGHGGKDTGAVYGQGEGRAEEKSFNLAVGKKIAELLSQQGAAVILTRSDDSYATLADRTETANLSKAHFFVSVHHNSNGKANSRSGTFTYYHEGDEESAVLAQTIQTEIAAVSGLPDHGILADTTRFPKRGFAVLRNSNMPAVLLEIAYINNDTDREKMKDEEFQQKVAEAVVKGIRVYIGDVAKASK